MGVLFPRYTVVRHRRACAFAAMIGLRGDKATWVGERVCAGTRRWEKNGGIRKVISEGERMSRRWWYSVLVCESLDMERITGRLLNKHRATRFDVFS